MILLSVAGCADHAYTYEVAPDLVVLEVARAGQIKGRYDRGDFSFDQIQRMAALACEDLRIEAYGEQAADNGDRLFTAHCVGQAAFDPGSELTFLWRDAQSADVLGTVSDGGETWRFRRILNY